MKDHGKYYKHQRHSLFQNNESYEGYKEAMTVKSSVNDKENVDHVAYKVTNTKSSCWTCAIELDITFS